MNEFFESIIEVPRMRVGKKQTTETSISEEARLLAKYLQHENTEWYPRIIK